MKLKKPSIQMREILATLAKKVVNREPQTRGRRAAVSIVLSDRIAPKVLLIRRSERDGDPWSGQIAFPGGKFQAEDESLRQTAIRETLEEVGIDLAAKSDFLGYLRTFRTHTGDMDVVPTVFLLREECPVRINEEVASFMWADLAGMLSGEANSTFRVRRGDEFRDAPAFKVGAYVIWGLTHRIISSLVGEDSP